MCRTWAEDCNTEVRCCLCIHHLVISQYYVDSSTMTGLKVWAVAGIDWKHGKHTSSDCWNPNVGNMEWDVSLTACWSETVLSKRRHECKLQSCISHCVQPSKRHGYSVKKHADGKRSKTSLARACQILSWGLDVCKATTELPLGQSDWVLLWRDEWSERYLASGLLFAGSCSSTATHL